MRDSRIVTRIPHFTDVIECRQSHNQQDTLHIYGNDEVDLTALSRIIESGQWNELRSLHGFFAGVYQTKDRAYLFCDRLGIYPLFYYRAPRCVYVSPSVPDLLKAARLKPKHCLEAVVSLLLFGHHLADETVIQELRRCNPGTTVKIDPIGSSEDVISWKADHIYQNVPSIQAPELGDLFVKEVERSIRNKDQIAVALSGGFDSRAVLGAVLECVGSERIHTLTFGDKDSYDRRIAEVVARRAGVKNSVFPVTAQIFTNNFLGERSGNYGYGYSAFATQPKDMLSHISEMSSQTALLWGGGGDAITGSHLRAGDLSSEVSDSLPALARFLIKKRCFLSLNSVSRMVGLDESEVIALVTPLLGKCVIGPYDKPWKFLDAWDIYVRGRLELVSVLPFAQPIWRCPHLGREYFLQMSTQCYQEKYNQNIYRRMLSSRFKSLFSLPSRRLKGKSLVGGQLRNLPWIIRWRYGRLPQVLKPMFGHAADSIGRNYGRNRDFLTGQQGNKRLRRSIEILTQQTVLPTRAEQLFASSTENVQAALMLITLGYAFEQRQ
jgi:hypothetical protein